MFKIFSATLLSSVLSLATCFAPTACAQTVVAGGFDYACALVKTEGTVKCWGSASTSGAGPAATSQTNSPRDTINLAGIVAIAGGQLHACALRNDGVVLCWGDNLYGQLGDPASSGVRTVKTPQPVVGLGGPVLAVFAGPGGDHTCAITASLSAKCWGRNRSGNLGNGAFTSNPVPQAVPGLGAVSGMAIGIDHTCAVTFAGAVLCWGDNGYGQLGDGSTSSRLVPTAVVGLASGVADIVAGSHHTCALLNNGGVKCWGRGSSGALGRGGATDASNPNSKVPVDVLTLASGATSIVAGDAFNCATLVSGGVRCWGKRPAGGGDGVQWTSSADLYQPTPVNVVGLSGPVVSIGSGFRYVCAVVTSGLVECWGDRPIDGGGGAVDARANAHLSGLNIDTRLVMAEYRHGSLDYFFMTSRYVEKLLFKALAPEFQPTGKSFFVFSTGLMTGTQPITRYYFDKVAKADSRGSHFYTLLDAERSALNALNPGNASAPKLPQNEGVDSFAFTPMIEGIGGSCAAGQAPLYRAFRGARFPDDPNHRFTTDIALYNSLVTAGWDGEGVKMCAPQ